MENWWFWDLGALCFGSCAWQACMGLGRVPHRSIYRLSMPAARAVLGAMACHRSAQLYRGHRGGIFHGQGVHGFGPSHCCVEVVWSVSTKNCINRCPKPSKSTNATDVCLLLHVLFLWREPVGRESCVHQHCKTCRTSIPRPAGSMGFKFMLWMHCAYCTCSNVNPGLVNQGFLIRGVFPQ